MTSPRRADNEAIVLDPSQAHSGRIHDVLLGAGKDAYLVDLEAGHKLITHSRAFLVAARATRLWLLRAVRYLASEQLVRQFVELGSGYPCSPNLHEVARNCAPTARMVYVDHDPVVAAHGRVFLADEQTEFVHADLSDTDALVAEITAAMDPSEPIAVCLSFVAEFLPDPGMVVDAVTTMLPSGSFLALSHITRDADPGPVDRAADIYAGFGIEFRSRSRDEVAALLAGYDLVEPGLVAPHRWWSPHDVDQRRARNLGWEPPQADDLCCRAAVGRLR